MINKKELLEKLAELEHKQWITWSHTLAIAEQKNISKRRLKKWSKLWKPYSKLSEKQKEQDRIWAREVIKLLKGDKNGRE